MQQLVHPASHAAFPFAFLHLALDGPEQVTSQRLSEQRGESLPQARVFDAQLGREGQSADDTALVLLSPRLVRLGAFIKRYPSGNNANLHSGVGLSKQR